MSLVEYLYRDLTDLSRKADDIIKESLIEIDSHLLLFQSFKEKCLRILLDEENQDEIQLNFKRKKIRCLPENRNSLALFDISRAHVHPKTVDARNGSEKKGISDRSKTSSASDLVNASNGVSNNALTSQSIDSTALSANQKNGSESCIYSKGAEDNSAVKLKTDLISYTKNSYDSITSGKCAKISKYDTGRKCDVKFNAATCKESQINNEASVNLNIKTKCAFKNNGRSAIKYATRGKNAKSSGVKYSDKENHENDNVERCNCNLDKTPCGCHKRKNSVENDAHQPTYQKAKRKKRFFSRNSNQTNLHEDATVKCVQKSESQRLHRSNTTYMHENKAETLSSSQCANVFLESVGETAKDMKSFNSADPEDLKFHLENMSEELKTSGDTQNFFKEESNSDTASKFKMKLRSHSFKKQSSTGEISFEVLADHSDASSFYTHLKSRPHSRGQTYVVKTSHTDSTEQAKSFEKAIKSPKVLIRASKYEKGVSQNFMSSEETNSLININTGEDCRSYKGIKSSKDSLEIIACNLGQKEVTESGSNLTNCQRKTTQKQNDQLSKLKVLVSSKENLKTKNKRRSRCISKEKETFPPKTYINLVKPCKRLRSSTAPVPSRPGTPLEYTTLQKTTQNRFSLKEKAEEKRRIREERMQKVKERRERLEKNREEKSRVSELRLKRKFEQHEEMLKKKMKEVKIKSLSRQQGRSKASSESSGGSGVSVPKNEKRDENNLNCNSKLLRNTLLKKIKIASNNHQISFRNTNSEGNENFHSESQEKCVGSNPKASLKVKEISILKNSIKDSSQSPQRYCSRIPLTRTPKINMTFLDAQQRTKALKCSKKSASQKSKSCSVSNENNLTSESSGDRVERNIKMKETNALDLKSSHLLDISNQDKATESQASNKIPKSSKKRKLMSFALKAGILKEKQNSNYSLRSEAKRHKTLKQSDKEEREQSFNGKNTPKTCPKRLQKSQEFGHDVSKASSGIGTQLKTCTSKSKSTKKIKMTCVTPKLTEVNKPEKKATSKSSKLKSRCLQALGKENINKHGSKKKLHNKQKETTSYEIPDLGYESEEIKVDPEKVPLWATGVHLKQALVRQHYKAPKVEEIFGALRRSPVDLTTIFNRDKPEYHRRTSSDKWSNNNSPA